MPARGEMWQSQGDKRNTIRLRSPYPNGAWRAELPDGQTVVIATVILEKRFVKVGEADGR